MKVLERRLRQKVGADGKQFGFISGIWITDAIFVVCQL